MKASEIREKSRDQLKEELIKKREELMNLRFKQANLALEGTAEEIEHHPELVRYLAP